MIRSKALKLDVSMLKYLKKNSSFEVETKNVKFVLLIKSKLNSS